MPFLPSLLVACQISIVAQRASWKKPECQEKLTLDIFSVADTIGVWGKGCLRLQQKAQSRALKDSDPLAGKETPSDIRDVQLGLGLSTAVSPQDTAQPCRGGASPSCFTLL